MADMTSVTVPALPAAAALTNTEAVPFHQNGRLVRGTPSALVEGGLPSARIAVGGRTGTLSELLAEAVTRGLVGTGTALSSVAAFRVLRRSGAGLAHASAAVRDHAAQVVGLSLAAASANASVAFLTAGPLEDDSFNFAPGPVYLGLDGFLTQVYPKDVGAAFALQVGVMLTPKSLRVALMPPVFLSY